MPPGVAATTTGTSQRALNARVLLRGRVVGGGAGGGR